MSSEQKPTYQSNLRDRIVIQLANTVLRLATPRARFLLEDMYKRGFASLTVQEVQSND